MSSRYMSTNNSPWTWEDSKFGEVGGEIRRRGIAQVNKCGIRYVDIYTGNTIMAANIGSYGIDGAEM